MADKSVRGRLLAAFFGISAFAALAAIAAMYAFVEVADTVERITERRVPSALASQDLSRHVARIASAARTIQTASTPEELEEISQKINGDFERVAELLVELRSSNIEPAAIESIVTIGDWLRLNIISLETVVTSADTTLEHKQALLGKLADTYAAVQRLLTPGILTMDADLVQLHGLLEDGSTTSDERVSKLARSIASLLPQEQASLEASTINDTLLKAASAETFADLEELSSALTQSLITLESLAKRIHPTLEQPLLDEVARLRALAEGPDSVLLARRRALEQIAVAERQIAENADLSSQLTAAVEQLVVRAKHDITNARGEALSVQYTGTIVLIAVVALSLISSALIVWLYVGRNLIARLTALSGSTQAIASGNLEASIPSAADDEIGRMAKALIVFRDTAAEVEETKRQVGEARQRLLDAIESISDGFALYDADDRLVLSNSRYRLALFPGSEEDVVPGTTFEAIIRSAAERGLIRDAEGRVDAWVEQRLKRHRHPSGPHVQQRTDGRWIQVNERKAASGTTVVVYTDISKLKHREQELGELVNKLKIAREHAMQAARAKSTFLASMSHELRTPLNAIIGFADVLQEKLYGELNQKQEEYLNDIATSGRHLLHLINDILDLSYIEAGRMVLEPNVFDLRQLLEDSLLLVQEQAVGHNITISLDVASDVDTVIADERKVKQIVFNVLSNAVKFTPDGGKVGVKAHRSDDLVEIAVWDTGVGIAPEDQQRIFEEFQQVGQTLTGKPAGTGLGLTLTKKLVELHGGTIWLESNLGDGSTFTFTLPTKGQAERRMSA
ncbi:MAG: ATP-binding protein [Acidiferrobacterales bacterium]